MVTRMQTLALAYAITGDVKYGERAVQYALDICDMEYWVGYYANVVVGGNQEWSSQMTGYKVALKCSASLADTKKDSDFSIS